MLPFTIFEAQFVITAVIFLLGSICFLVGIYILLRRRYTREIQSLATKTTLLGQKGISSEVSGLVTSASELVYAINQLVKTSSGIGAFLMMVGLALVGISFWALQQLILSY